VNNGLPNFFRLKQLYNSPSVTDVAGATRAALAQLPARQFIRQGMTVAVGAGSRGIANYDLIVRTVCAELKNLGATVFIIPAMGSHGGATADGQLDVLAHYGITEAAMGVPIRSSMDVVELGRVGEFRLFQDRHAAAADAIVLVNRVKPHTDFHGPLESGLMKMAAIGLGKQKGAHQFHQATVRFGHAEALLTIGRELLKHSRIVFGVAIIENQLHETARVAAVPASRLESMEMELLEEARRLMPQLPFEEVDLLIVDELGKNISGSGLDTNVIRRDADGSFIRGGRHPVRRIYVRSLHPHSYGNAVGIGMADFIHEKLLQALDPKATWVNAITALMPANARVPMHFASDREALQTALETLGPLDSAGAKILWIKNTLSCEQLLASEGYLAETRARADLAPQSQPAPPGFDAHGDLMPVF
jgi:hypothetical protein